MDTINDLFPVATILVILVHEVNASLSILVTVDGIVNVFVCWALTINLIFLISYNILLVVVNDLLLVLTVIDDNLSHWRNTCSLIVVTLDGISILVKLAPANALKPIVLNFLVW